MISVREATAADWPRLFPIFQAVIDAGETIAYPEGLSSQDAQALWLEAPPGRTVLVETGSEVLGTARMGPNRPGRGAHVATASFMVAAPGRGRGIGRVLGQYVLDWARDEGYRSIQFNAVVETNAMALRLWSSLGFEIIGTVPRAFDHREHGLVGLHVMHRFL